LKSDTAEPGVRSPSKNPRFEGPVRETTPRYRVCVENVSQGRGPAARRNVPELFVTRSADRCPHWVVILQSLHGEQRPAFAGSWVCREAAHNPYAASKHRPQRTIASTKSAVRPSPPHPCGKIKPLLSPMKGHPCHVGESLVTGADTACPPIRHRPVVWLTSSIVSKPNPSLELAPARRHPHGGRRPNTSNIT